MEVVPDIADPCDRLILGVGYIPVEVTIAAVDGAGVAAARRDHDVGVDDAIGERFRVGLGEVQAAFGEDLNGQRVDLICGGGASRTDMHLPADRC